MSFFDSNQPTGPTSPMGEQPDPPKLSRRGRGKGKDRKARAAAPAEAASKKVHNRQLRLAIGFAAAAAVVVGLISLGSQSPSLYVVQVTDNIAAGATVNIDKQLKAVPVDKEHVLAGSYSGPTESAALKLAKEDLDGVRVQYPLLAGEQVNKNDFSTEIALDTPLKPGERLMSIQANVANAVAGKIKPGDRVDIAASDGDVSSVVLTNVPVVSVTVSESQYQSVASQQTGDGKNTSPEELLPGQPVPGIYTVRVPAGDAGRLFAVDANADLALIYRPAEATEASHSPRSARAVICEGFEATAECR